MDTSLPLFYLTKEASGLLNRNCKIEDMRLNASLRVMENRRALVRADGTPFFWLGDTAWGSAYRTTRGAQGFTVIQLSSLPLLSDFSAEEVERHPFPILSDNEWDFDRPDADYFAQLQWMIEYANKCGLSVALIALWWTYVPNARLWSMAMPRPVMSLEQGTRYVQYLAELLEGLDVIWLLTGDDTFHGEGTVEYTRALGGALRAADPNGRLISVHPSRISGDCFHAEDWLDLNMIQSSHFDAYPNLAYEYTAQEWGRQPKKPVVNGEICYEGHAGFDYGHVLDRYDVRRAAWWSVLSGCLVGITYGANGIWKWFREEDRSGKHKVAFQLWREALELAGATDLCRMRILLEEIEWWRLEPAQGLLVSLPIRHTAVAAAPDGQLLVAYIPRMPPTCATIALDLQGMSGSGYLWDAETGERTRIELPEKGNLVVAAPDGRDVVVVIKKAHSK